MDFLKKSVHPKISKTYPPLLHESPPCPTFFNCLAKYPNVPRWAAGSLSNTVRTALRSVCLLSFSVLASFISVGWQSVKIGGEMRRKKRLISIHTSWTVHSAGMGLSPRKHACNGRTGLVRVSKWRGYW
jgi:hypothetical protein